jgi:hypothetical protein
VLCCATYQVKRLVLKSGRLRHIPLLSGLQVPEWQELAKDRQKWRNVLKSIRTRK